MTDQEYEELEDQLRPRLTEEFLSTLIEAVRINGDWDDTSSFIRNIFAIAGKEVPEIEPYA